MIAALLISVGISLLCYIALINMFPKFRPRAQFTVDPFAIFGLALALLARDKILSPWFILLGLFLSYWERRRKKRGELKKTIDHTIALIRGISNYLFGAIGPALKDAAEALPPGAVKDRALQAWRRYASGEFWDEAIEVLFGLNPLLDRLAYFLLAAPKMSTDRVKEALNSLSEEYTKVMQIRAESGVELTLVSLTIQFMLLANAAAVVLSLIFPAWRSFYTSSLAHRGTMMAANISVLAAYIYFQEEIGILEEAA
jgi:hypothetical protein